ncbi:hypothetical protein IMSHALPRED_009959 [Imshaugia aleurites]|uniref:Uncharacterized protein n=1 Tax=Imshaugia aleurites TaxID=172621 RepID=A0A8H3EYJ1_9LECA|nr:hypothetical protein IMSHALPRED_009959 [Imshaugia aleurites]
MVTTVTAFYTPLSTMNETFAHLLNPSNLSLTLPPDRKPLEPTLSITFHPFGHFLQSSTVNTALRGAFREIAHYRPDETITNNNFHYRAAGGNVGINTAGYLNRHISWAQLAWTLRQVSQFMNGGPAPGGQHMQELSFEIFAGEGKIGDGFIFYYPSGSTQAGYAMP